LAALRQVPRAETQAVKQPPSENPVPSTIFGLTAITAAALATGLHLRAQYHGPRWQVYLFKPLIAAVLLVLAALSQTAHGTPYQLAVALGLACSLLGDIFLMLPTDRFLPGLSSFLLAHVAYMLAFTSGVPIGTAPALLLPLLAAAVLVLHLVWYRLGALRLPVLLYSATILLMVWRAWVRQWALPTPASSLAAAGATLFMVSDALLAVNRFRNPFPSAQTLIMTTYMLAQAFIALSVGTP
jgi:uncharacterized membrane protein YhhN